MAKAQVKKKTPGSEREPDPWFNPYRSPASERALNIVGDVLNDLEKRETRTRARKTKDRQWLWQVGHALVADLAYHHLNRSPGSGLVVPRAKRELGKTQPLPSAVFHAKLSRRSSIHLERRGYLRQKKGAYSGMPGRSRRTTIRAGDQLIALIEKHQVTFADLQVKEVEEVIILKRAKRNHWDQGEKISYSDTAVTRRLRAEVREVNAWLERADIMFEPFAHDRPVDIRARRLYRYFAGDFESGGRLFKGFWQNLPKRARLLGLLIQGEQVVELDYAQLNPMLAYARVGCSPPSGDAYTLPGLEQHRDGVKKVFNAMLFDRGPRKSFPEGVNVFFPKRTKIGDVVGAIREKHPRLGSELSYRGRVSSDVSGKRSYDART